MLHRDRFLRGGLTVAVDHGHGLLTQYSAFRNKARLARDKGAVALIVITGPNDEVRIPRKEIVKMGYAPLSLMPEGFEEILSRQEMIDLIASQRAYDINQRVITTADEMLRKVTER